MTVHVCATKPQTNDTDGVDAPIYGLMSAYVHPEIGGLTDDWDVFAVSNVYFSSFGKTGDVVSAGITIGENSIGWWDTVRIYATDNLENPVWTNVYEHDYQNESSLMVRFDMSQFPTSFLNQAFFGLDFPADSDGDGIDDGPERYIHHSNPYKYDTDGDGLGDGEELRIGSSPIMTDTDGDGLSDSEELGGSTVMTDSSMLWLDTSSCTELALGNGGFGKSWNIAVPGGVSLAGAEYFGCKAYLYGRLSFGDDEVYVDAVGQTMYAYPAWASKVIYGMVISDGVDYFVVEYRNISPDSSGSVKLTCQIVIPTSVRNVVYVSYQRVDGVIDDQYYPLGVTCYNMSSPFDPPQVYSILPPLGHRIPVAGTTTKYTIGLGSDSTVYNRYEEPTLPPTSNSNAYYTVDIVADDHAHIVFSGDGLSDLPDPDFWALPGDTNRVKLLMGKSYVANADVGISCVGASDSEAVVSNIFDRAISVVRPVRITAIEGNGLGFLMRVNPSNLNGEFSWTNSCCSITGRGNEYWYVHTGECTCNGCYAQGVYVYEGYALGCEGGYCDCPHYRDEWPHPQEDEGPYAANISVSFSAPAVIFEDAYNNNPTSTVPRRSTQTLLSCVVHGGETGGTASFRTVNASKIDSVEGDLPSSIFVPPMQKLEFDVCYEGSEPSVSADDVVVTGTFTPRNGGTTLTDSDTLTSIRLSMTAIYEAPENPCTNRHVYGVGEKVRFKVEPVVFGANLRVVKADSGDNVTDYDTFGYEREIAVSGDDVYQCPAIDTIPDVTLRYKGVEYRPSMSVIEPQSVEVSSVSREGSFSLGDVCMGLLVARVHVRPFDVSFSGVQIYEVPCTNAIPPTGYFASTNYQGMLTHVYPNAGYLHIPDRENYWATDRAGRSEPYENWSAGTLTWKIPIGWRRIRRGEETLMATRQIDYALYDNDNSRPLFIGGREDAYSQTFKIESNGTSSIRKFGYKLERNRWLPFGIVSQTGEDE